MREMPGLRTYMQVHRARRDHADKAWLREEAELSDRESHERMECLTFVAILIAGATLGFAAYDWTQDMEWARALVALVYRTAPL